MFLGRNTPTLCKFCRKPFELPSIPEDPSAHPTPPKQSVRPPKTPARSPSQSQSQAQPSGDKDLAAKLHASLKDKVDEAELATIFTANGLSVPKLKPAPTPYESYVKSQKEASHCALLISHQQEKICSLADQLATCESTIVELDQQRLQAEAESERFLALHQRELPVPMSAEVPDAERVKGACALMNSAELSSQLERLASTEVNQLPDASLLLGELRRISSQLKASLQEVDSSIVRVDQVPSQAINANDNVAPPPAALVLEPPPPSSSNVNFPDHDAFDPEAIIALQPDTIILDSPNQVLETARSSAHRVISRFGKSRDREGPYEVKTSQEDKF